MTSSGGLDSESSVSKPSCNIVVLVGSEEKQVIVHVRVLLQGSSFFLTTVGSKDFQAKEDKIGRLPEVDETTFATYLRWVSRKFTCEESDKTLLKDPFPLVHLYICAEFLGNNVLSNLVCNQLYNNMKSFRKGSRPILVQIANTRSSPGSALRQTLVNEVITKGTEYFFDDFHDLMPREFLTDLAAAREARANKDKNETVTARAPKRKQRSQSIDHEHSDARPLHKARKE